MRKLMLAMLVFAFMVSGQSLLAEESVIKAPPEGNLRYSITVTKFKNEAGWSGKWSIGDGMSTIMTNMLSKSGWFVVLGDDEMRKAAMKEQDFAASGRTAGGKKSAKVGRMTPAQLLVRGSITHVQDVGSKKGGLSFAGISLGGSSGEAEVNITIYLVDSETGQVKASTDIVGKSGRQGYSLGYHGSALGGLGGNFGGEDKDNVGKAVQDAVGQAVNYLVEQLDSVSWEGTVILVKGKKYIVNRGTRDGVSKGKVFAVGSVEELVDPDTGEVLDSEMEEVGKLKVTKVKEKVAYCSAVKGSGKISKGMTVFEDN